MHIAVGAGCGETALGANETRALRLFTLGRRGRSNHIFRPKTQGGTIIIFQVVFFLAMASIFGLVALDYRDSIERFTGIISLASSADKDNIHRGVVKQIAATGCLIFLGLGLVIALDGVFPDR
ncbi:hypothetical protein GCM10009716_47930 [Streptomyces sodiiphilus]|uniref:Uncharacterized protein n=1 Tax=Streptomyces sodiiphilus TaxID=226217 RepID=A0ABN2PWF6_9ACTN